MSYSDIDAFGAYTQAALTDPTYGGEEIIRSIGNELKFQSTFDYINQDAGYNMKFYPHYSKFKGKL